MIVDEVSRLEHGKGGGIEFVRLRHGDGGHAQQAQVPGTDRCFTAARGLDEARIIHGGHAGIGGIVFAPARHVLAVSITELRGHFEL